MQVALIRTRAWFPAIFSVMALLGLPLRCAASVSGCQVHATNYLGWKAEEMSNPWVKLEIVPQIGGRLIQVTFGGHDFLYINPLVQGQVSFAGGHRFRRAQLRRRQDLADAGGQPG